LSPPRGAPILPRPVRVGLALVLAAGAIAAAAGADAPAQPAAGAARQDPRLVAQGQRLFAEGCSSCHGPDARGIRGVAPSLHGVGAASADFYLRTGRMPLDDPKDEPVRGDPAYPRAQIDALVAYVASFGGPPIPKVDAAAGRISEGLELFTEHCAGCHQVVGQGGIVTRGVVPELQDSKPVDVAEAIEVGPYVMPHFRDLTRDEVSSLARYATYTGHPEDRGGWGIGHIGPIPEGMVAWLLAGAALLLVIRLIGERTAE
jgi:ubiquinol-cytochrome c reductase cytochrome c subunit